MALTNVKVFKKNHFFIFTLNQIQMVSVTIFMINQIIMNYLRFTDNFPLLICKLVTVFL